MINAQPSVVKTLALVVNLLTLFCGSAQAQNLSEYEKLLKQGMDRLEQQTAPLKERPDVRLPRPEPVNTNLSALDDSDKCFEINEIVIKDSKKLSGKVTNRAVSPFVGHCLGLERINALVGVISNLYLEQGFITSRAYIPPQDLSDGSLDLVVVEGVIEDFASSDNSITAQQLRLAFPSQTGEVLNIRALEQGVENLNSVSRNNARLDLRPGSQQGQTLVAVTNQQSRGWRGSVGVNNYGVPSTGEYQLDGNVVVDNPIGYNDTAFVSASSNVGGHDLPHAQSRSYSASWSMPLGYWHFSFNNSYYEYEQTVVGDVTNFSISGSSTNNALQLGRNIFRSQADKLDLTLGFTRKVSKNYIEDVFLETSSRTLYVWDLTIDYRRFLESGTFTLSAGAVKSVPWFDAKRQLVAEEDNFQFSKYHLTLGYNTQFDIKGQRFFYNASADFLYAPEVILASEGITVGGRYSVRGLSQSSLFGYRGGYLRNDLSLPVPVNSAVVSQVQYFAGLDAGWTNLPEYPEKQNDWVAGAIAGLKLLGNRFSLTFSYARALRVPDFLPQQQQEIDASVRFNF